MKIEINCPGEKLAIKIWKTVADKGIGKLLTPWQLKREAAARLDIRENEMLRIAKVEALIDSMKDGSNDVGILFSDNKKDSNSSDLRIEPYLNLEELKPVLENQLFSDELRREVNVAKSIRYAGEQARYENEEPSEEEIQDDWLYRWREYAGEVSSDSLQQLWGRLLLGEVKNPGKFSLRTLDFIRNLSTNEATRVELLRPMVISDWIYRGDWIADEGRWGVNLELLLEMEELGLIMGVANGQLNFDINAHSHETGGYVRIFPSSGHALVITNSIRASILNVPVFKLTTLGQQVLELALSDPNDDYLRYVGVELGKQGFAVNLAHKLEQANGRFHASEQEKLT